MPFPGSARMCCNCICTFPWRLQIKRKFSIQPFSYSLLYPSPLTHKTWPGDSKLIWTELYMSLSSFVLLIRRCSYTFTGLTFMQGCLSLDQTVLFTVNGSRQALSFWEDDNKYDLRLWCYQHFCIHAFGWCFKGSDNSFYEFIYMLFYFYFTVSVIMT